MIDAHGNYFETLPKEHSLHPERVYFQENIDRFVTVKRVTRTVKHKPTPLADWVLVYSAIAGAL
jgi:hypothetical protein